MRQSFDHITRPVVRFVTLSLVFALPGTVSAEPVPALSVAGAAGSFGNRNHQDAGEHTLWLELEGYKPLEPAENDAPGDLLARLRSGFTIETSMNRHIQAHLDRFVRHPEYLELVFNRAQRYMPYIVDELEKRGLPLELALLPIVESAYDPFAYSHGRAAGLWQIIPGTATRFGIRQNWWYDGRRDVVDSTDGALSYLEYLHELMDGDWLLAIASYNSGEGNVLRAAKRNRSRSRPTDFWNLTLPKETISYVPKLLALVELVRDPEAFGVELPELVDTPQFAQTDVGGQLDLALAAELAGVDVDTLYAFNAGFNHWATDPEGPHRLVLPVDVSEVFNEALAALPADERVRWQRHKVRSGETLSEIAEAISHDDRGDSRRKRHSRQHDSRRQVPDRAGCVEAVARLQPERGCAPRENAEPRTRRHPGGAPREFRRKLLVDRPPLRRRHEAAGRVERHGAAGYVVSRPETGRMD